MPYVDVVSIKCHDEQEFGSDEVYVFGGYGLGGSESRSPVYGGMDTNDVVYPEFGAVPFSRGASVTLALWENDGDNDNPVGDDLIGNVTVRFTPEHIGTHTVTLAESGANYDLTYKVWA